MEERLVRFRPRAILVVLGIILAGVVLIEIVQAAQGVLIWIFVAIFLALALNPAVDWLQRRGVAAARARGHDRLRRRDPRDRRARRHDHPDDRLPGERVRRRRARLRRGPDRRARPARVPRARVPDHRAGAGGARRGRRLEAARDLGDRARGDEGCRHRRRRHAHDRVPDALHAARRAGVGRAALQPPAGREAAALAQGRPRHLPDDRRLRDRQPGDQPDRRRHLDGGAARASASRTRSRSGCSWRSST